MLAEPVQVTAVDHVYGKRTNLTDVLVALGLGVFLTGGSYLLALLFGWITSLNWIEVVAVFTAYAGTYLCVVQRRINYPINAISTAAYAILFLQQGLLSSAILNFYLTPALLYGWFRWRSDRDPRPVRHVEIKWLPVYLGATILAYVGAVTVTTLLGGKLATLDAIILAGTILAQFLLDNKKIETWFVWVIVNVIAIYEYFAFGLPLAGVQYILFLANTVYGYIAWKKTMK